MLHAKDRADLKFNITSMDLNTLNLLDISGHTSNWQYLINGE